MTKARRSSCDMTTVLQNLRIGRSGAISICMSVRVNSPEYRAADTVVEAVDDLVACLTGDQTLLHTSAHRTRTGSKQSGGRE